MYCLETGESVANFKTKMSKSNFRYFRTNFAKFNVNHGNIYTGGFYSI